MANQTIVGLKKKLKKHNFKGCYNADQIANIGKRFIRRYIALHDSISMNQARFCKTVDGKWVFFKTIADKLLTRENNAGIRTIDIGRIRRLHWIIPILEGKTQETILFEDFLGKTISPKCQPNLTYRVYWIPASETRPARTIPVWR